MNKWHLWDSCQISGAELQHRRLLSPFGSFFGLINSNTTAVTAQHVIPFSKLGIVITKSCPQCDIYGGFKERFTSLFSLARLDRGAKWVGAFGTKQECVLKADTNLTKSFGTWTEMELRMDIWLDFFLEVFLYLRFFWKCQRRISFPTCMELIIHYVVSYIPVHISATLINA